MNAITRPGGYHESRFLLYARGLSRGKFNPSAGPDRGVTDPPPSGVETVTALGSDQRSDDASLARPRQKRRWWARFALGCLLICALGGADADQRLRFAPDGSLLGREWGGTCLYWASSRGPSPDSRSLQHSSGLCGIGQSRYRRGYALGDQASPCLWLCRRGGDLVGHHGTGVGHWLP